MVLLIVFAASTLFSLSEILILSLVALAGASDMAVSTYGWAWSRPRHLSN